jgi:hypothetical protein
VITWGWLEYLIQSHSQFTLLSSLPGDIHQDGHNHAKSNVIEIIGFAEGRQR